ncbi:replicative DNA helicase [candidate division NPL-UPA2 bacterium]|nr:replicative DNA helicase [candidate division NPL-UPA2 bacterium]
MAGQDVSLEKVPPQNLEAEMSVLGSMLMEEEAIAQAIEFLEEKSFYHKAHRKTFSAILSLYDKDGAVDLITLTEQLRKQGDLEEVGGAAYLTSLMNSVPTAANVEYYARIVQEKAILRSLINTATQIVAESYSDRQEVDLFLDKVESLVFSVSQRRIRRDFISVKELIHDSIELAETLTQKKQLVTGLATGFADLDTLTSGFQPSDLIIIAGRPSMGKSSLAINIALHAGVEKKVPVAFFSMEMSKEQLVQRMLCSEARVDAHKLRTGFLKSSAFTHLTNAAGRLAESPIFIDDSPGISSLEVRAKARRLKSKENIGLIIIDYLQLMQGRFRTENRQQEISEISRSLKSLARELNIAVVALSQLSRAVESREPPRPRLADLRESGAIEQDADLVAFLYREEYYKKETDENRGIADLNIAKQRNGPVGNIKLTFIKEYTRFENYSRWAGQRLEDE